ncbi:MULTISPECIES: AMP-binding protein [unclassified Streptomyces]|uniref:AMP-binding protein n=1 Tax=unclassified Streptomyces TaxID=2593676 RepID=UPI002E2A8925|nr:AMP-binding protein [Streptomyces sp. NBC_00223]
MPSRTLYDWFSQAAERYPGEVALEVADTALTFDELLELSDRIAARLLAAHGGRPEAVGLLAVRSVAAFAGYLAALRLRTPVVPLNPSFPANRNVMIARAAGVAAVLVGAEAGEAYARNYPPGVTTVLRLDDDALVGEISGAARPALPPYTSAVDEVAYIVFTSGSTGVPKGVPITHRNVDRYIDSQIERYEPGPGSRFSQTFELTFDPSIFDMFVCWGSGATLVVPTAADLLSPADYARDQGLTHWFSAPSTILVAHQSDELPPNSLPEIRWSRFSGEALTLRQARLWRAAAPGSVIENVYGPTELTMTCSGYRLPADAGEWPATANDTVPIGTVYPYLESVILDPDGRPAEDGELCVRGVQRFAGYLDPSSNAGRFMEYDGIRPAAVYRGGTPLTEEHWYRTGDRVVLLGQDILHLGRLDAQIKLRGFRVELGEVETVLNRHPAVVESAAVVITSDDVSDLAVAYAGTCTHPRELIAFIRESLPLFMVPRTFLHLDRLPLNINGKVDKHRITADIQERLLAGPAS